MAIWQYKLHLLPKQNLQKIFGSIPDSLREDIAEEPLWWKDVILPEAIEISLDALLSPAISWSDEIRMWGDEDSNHASICYDNAHKIEWIEFRVDARKKDNVYFIDQIYEFSKKYDCILMTFDHRIISNKKTILEDFNNSTACLFLTNPTEALKKAGIPIE